MFKEQKNDVISHIASQFPTIITEHDYPNHYVPSSPSPRSGTPSLSPNSNTHFTFDNVQTEKPNCAMVGFILVYINID